MAAIATTRTTSFPLGLVLTLLAGLALSVTDAFITFVAAPSIRTDLHAGAGEIELLPSAYVLTLASLMITGARLGDRFGLQRVFRAGLVAFALASTLCAAAPSATTLIVGRGLQGAAAALMSPQVLAGFRGALSDAHRGRAMGLYGATAGIAGTAGQLLGGALIALDLGGLGWRWCFLVNVPVAAVALAASYRTLPVNPPRPAVFDRGGVLLSGTGLGGVVVAVTEGRALGWPAWSIVALVAGLVLIGVLAVHERRLERIGRAPLLPPSLLAAPTFGTGLLLVALVFFGASGFYLPLALLFQQGLGLGPLSAGVAFVPLGAAYYAGSRHGARHIRDVRATRLLAGLGAMLAGWALVACELICWGTDVSVFAVSATVAVVGAGQGMIAAPLLGIVLGRAPREHAGSAGGVLATVQQLGNVAGVAAVGGTVFAVAGTRPEGASLVNGFLAGLGVLAASVMLLALLLLRRPRPRRHASPRDTPCPEVARGGRTAPPGMRTANRPRTEPPGAGQR